MTPRALSWAAALCPPAVLVLLAVLQPDFSYNRWDNYEIHTAIVTRAHGMLLAGSFPHLNPHQHLGEPLHAAMQCGALYLPYTLCLLLCKLLMLPTAAFPLVSAAVHAGAGSVGWMRLLGRLGVRAELGAVVGVAAGLAGFGLIWAPLWLFAAAILALIPWLLLATWRVLDAPGLGSTGWLALGLAAVLFVGYPTWAVYVWLFVAVFAVAWASASGAPRRALAAVPGFVLGGLLAAPFLVPALTFLRSTPRAGAMAADEVLRRAASPSVLLDLLLPVFHHANGFIGPRISVHLHLAGWLVPALIGAWMLRGKGTPALRAGVLVGSGMAIGFFVLALGRAGGLLPLTLWVPVWNSFRWPFKFLPLVLAGLTLAGGCGLELIAQHGRVRMARVGVGLAGLTGAALLVQVVVAGDPRTTGMTFASLFGVGAALTGLVGLAGGGFVSSPRGRVLLLLLAPLHALLMVGLTQVWGARGYLAPWGAQDAEQLGIDAEHRVLPLTSFPFRRHGNFEQFAVGHAASANGYLSATGTKTEGLMPTWYLDVFPTDHLGVVDPAISVPLVGSSLLRGLAVRWYVVGRTDGAVEAALTANPALEGPRVLDEVAIFHDPGALPRAWLAERIVPWSVQTELDLRESRLPPRTALLPGAVPSEPGAGSITSADWRDQDASFVVAVPQGGLLVFAMTWNPGWSAAVDDVPYDVLRVNRVASAVVLPPGARRVEIRYRTPGLPLGVALAGFGALGWLGLLIGAGRRGGASRPSATGTSLSGT